MSFSIGTRVARGDKRYGSHPVLVPQPTPYLNGIESVSLEYYKNLSGLTN
jgi:hypothetical protein